MDAERRETIVLEIQRWRRSRLLPEQYCDFLLNLYQDESDKSNVGRQVMGIPSNVIRDSGIGGWLGFMAAIAIISCVVFYFTSFDLPMQIGVTALGLLVSFGAGAWWREKLPSLSYLAFGIGCIALFAAGFAILKQQGLLTADGILLLVAGCSLVWLAVGISARMNMFHFCGWVGLLLAYVHVLKAGAPHLSWFSVQMSFLPLGVLFIWIGRLLMERHRRVAPVYFSIGGLLWFAAEPFLLYAGIGGTGWIPVAFLVKLTVAGAILFALRKTWTEWIGE
ncbi:hypothetical protein ACFQWB_01525 [Paenibacillus thermoaerophilus]|uniref:DUF2157 domain-containing protein n=1 Tax=Paenibacillus thermoaerophilus TaxID=1215385 RepID=A0ABW2V1H5_9BACL|nr:hypothetical protein [Paenibacillus thermoaerophilus]TMV19039.1 hypothetical protein FE781_00550 [Paenibacillus thermoaerophilus]